MKQMTDQRQFADCAQSADVAPLIPVEDPRIDPKPMIHLFSRMEEAAAEQEICDILDDISVEISLLRMASTDDDLKSLVPNVERLARRSGRLGLQDVSRVASDVVWCLRGDNQAALHATISRLIRVSDQSMSEIWDARYI